MFWLGYNLLFFPVYLLLLPRFFARMLKRGGYGANFGQRIGCYDRDLQNRLAEPARRVWIHAVSVGEVGVAKLLMNAWREADPELRFVLSVTTSTGNEVARKAVRKCDEVLYFPVDTPWISKKVLRQIRPEVYVMVEQEYWPNLLRACRRDGVPTAVVNGRVSDRSFPRYMKIRFLTKRVMPLIDRFLMQSEQDAERITAMGAAAERVKVIPSLKYQVARPDPVNRSLVRTDLDRLGWKDAPILLGGSIWPGEWEILLEVFQRVRVEVPTLRLVLVPRHAERAGEVVAAIKEAGLRFARRSEGPPHDGPESVDVYVVDTTGELLSFYANADVVFVGKSLTQKGGQNPIEAARCGRAILTGPNMQNFPGVMADFRRAEAVSEVESAEELFSETKRLLLDEEARRAMGARAESIVEANTDVVGRAVRELLELRG